MNNKHIHTRFGDTRPHVVSRHGSPKHIPGAFALAEAEPQEGAQPSSTHNLQFIEVLSLQVESASL